jgi:STIP1 family protein 1
MEDPVVTDSGQVYERFAIEEHIEKNGRTDPFTRQPLKGPLYPCITIKKAIQEFLDRNPWAYEYTEG